MAEPFLCPKCGRQCDHQHCPVCQTEFDEDWTLLDDVEDGSDETTEDADGETAADAPSEE